MMFAMKPMLLPIAVALLICGAHASDFKLQAELLKKFVPDPKFVAFDKLGKKCGQLDQKIQSCKIPACKSLCATCETVAAALKLATQAKDDEHTRMNTKGETLAKRHCSNAKTKESEAKWIVFDQLSQKRHQIEKKLGSCKIPSCKSLCPTCEKVDADLKLATQAMIDFSLTIEYANKGESLASLEAKSKNLLLETAALFKKAK